MNTALIVDDEPVNAEQLSRLLKEVAPEIQVEGIAHNTLEALTMIRKKNPEMIFLDVEMPGSSGFELLPLINENVPKIVFVTAYDHYAIQALRSGADDYLLKPVSGNELLACLDRIHKQNGKSHKEIMQSNGILRFSVKDGFVFVRSNELLHIEGSGSYTYLHLANGSRHMISKNIGQVEKLIEGEACFFRCHNSHIVNLQYVKRFISSEGNFVQLSDGSKVQVSRTQKDELLRLLSN